MTPPRISRTKSAKKKVRFRNAKSPMTPRRDFAADSLGRATSKGIFTFPLTSRDRLCCSFPLPFPSVPSPRGTRGRRGSLSSLRWPPGPHWLPVGPFDLLPALLDRFYDAVRHRHVIELLCRLAAVVIGPVEEIQRLARDLGLGLLLVHQDEARPGNRPAVFPWLVGQQQIEILCLSPVCIRRRRLKGLDFGSDELAVLVAEQRKGQFVLFGIG